MKNLLKKTLKFCLIAFLRILHFTLKVLAIALTKSTPKEKYRPTLEERMCGEKLPFTGKYFVPDEQSDK